MWRENPYTKVGLPTFQRKRKGKFFSQYPIRLLLMWLLVHFIDHSSAVTIVGLRNTKLIFNKLKAMIKSLQESYISSLNSHLESLSVQKKLLDIITLSVSRGIMTCFRPAGQLPFIIPGVLKSTVSQPPRPFAVGDYCTDSSCKLCKSPYCTVSHIMNGCPIQAYPKAATHGAMTQFLTCFNF